MIKKIECRTTAKGIQSYYLIIGDKEYYLFCQNFRKSNKEFFGAGRYLDAALNFTGVHSYSVKRTIEKLKTYIPYIEKEYGIAILNKTKRLKNKRIITREVAI